MAGIFTPSSVDRNFVIAPLRPSSRIQEYAPMNGADMLHRMATMNRSFAPRIL